MAKLDDTEIHRIVQNEIDDAVLYQQEEHTGFCDLRSTALTNLGNKGVTMAEIVSFSGHKLNPPILETDVYFTNPLRGRNVADLLRHSLNLS